MSGSDRAGWRGRAAVRCLLLLPIGCGFSAAGATEARPQGTGRGAAVLEVEVDGTMAPVTARIVFACPEAAGRPVMHVIVFGGAGHPDIVAESRISVSRAFTRTTEIRGLCRDTRGAELHGLPRIVVAVDSASQRDSVLELGNAARAAAGVGRLSPDSALEAVAAAHARDMAEREYFGHVTPEGRDLGERFALAHIVYTRAAENIGGNSTAAAMVRAWLESPGHRQNLLGPAFDRTGVGVYRTPSSPYTYYVQVFAK